MEDTESQDYAATAAEVNNLMEGFEDGEGAKMEDADEGRHYIARRSAQPSLFGFGGRYGGGYRHHHHHHHHGHRFGFHHFG
jgi:hypothetical protein